MAAIKQVDTEDIIAAYQATGSVWKAGIKVGLCGQSVHERLKKVGYPIPSGKWTDEEHRKLRELAGHASLSQIVEAIGRPYGSVACRLSAMGISGRAKPKPASFRGTGLTKDTVAKLIKELDSFSGQITHFCKQRGMKVDLVVKAIQKYQPEFWVEYTKRVSSLAAASCEYCEGEFYPLTKKQKTCSRKCQSHLRADKQYFNGQRKSTIGMAEGICQICLREKKTLSSHHVWGKENDEEATFLIALCNGCHHVLGQLASTKQSGDSEFLERLIIFANMRRNGERKPSGFHCFVEVEELTDKECSDETW